VAAVHRRAQEDRRDFPKIKLNARRALSGKIRCLLRIDHYRLWMVPAHDQAGQEVRMSEQMIQRAQEVKRRHEKELMRKPNVVAVGIGFRSRGGQPTNQVCIVVSVKVKLAASQLKSADMIPASIENIPIDVIATGEIRAL
jgi:hypothetical protein